MGQDPDAIRREIEATRGRMGATVDALGYKTDVKSRVQDSISSKTGAVSDSVSNLMSRVSGKASDMSESTPSGSEISQRGRRAAGLAQENPIGLAIGAAALGFLAGLVIPSSRVEHERLGQASDQVKRKALETGQEALDRGKQVAGDVATTAKETAKESGQQHAQELTQSAQQNAQEAGQAARSELRSDIRE